MREARAIAEETARTSYGRLLAWLSVRTRDVAAAEDALADAFRAALETWPERGVPDAPDAWIFTAAKRKLIDAARRGVTRQDAIPALTLAADEAEAAMLEDAPFPDERLKLLFICAHPAIDENIRTPLMLQTVLGLDAARIASAFLVSPAAMSGRLVRAKRKIKAAAIPFEPPPPETLPERLTAVLETIYAAFGAAWDAAGAENSGDLTSEATYLAQLVTELLPDSGEAWGLLSLMLHAHARSSARCIGGTYIPLDAQDTKRWNRELINAGEAALARAWKCGEIGPYQLEAAIQSAHAARRLHGRDTHGEIVRLYQTLVEMTGAIGAIVGFAGALAAANRSDEGIAVLNNIDESFARNYQPYWAVRAHLLAETGKKTEAIRAFDQAIGLSSDAAARRFLTNKKAGL